MANGGTRAYFEIHEGDTTTMYYDNWVHIKTGSLGFWYSKNPYEPWKQFYWNKNWYADDPENRLYLPQLSPKWISNDGKDMYMIFSDAGR